MENYDTDGEIFKPGSRLRRYNSDEIRSILEEEYDGDDDTDLVSPNELLENEVSDAEQDGIIEDDDDEYDSDASVEDENLLDEGIIHIAKDNTEWSTMPPSTTQTRSLNILRQRSGPSTACKNLNFEKTFKTFISSSMTSIILRETNRKAQKIIHGINEKIIHQFPDVSERPPLNDFIAFTEEEFNAFLGILIMAGVHRSNKEHIEELWSPEAIPLYRAAMSRNRFKLLLRCIRFDNDSTRQERMQTDKAAPIRDIWLMFIENLQGNYKPSECLTVDEQLFPYRGRTKFTQYIPSKPAKYGIKIFWLCDSLNSYPLLGEIYTGKSTTDERRQTNVGESVVLKLVKKYRNSGRNITMDNFFTSLPLNEKLSDMGLTLVGTLRKNKTCIPSCLQPNRERQLLSTKFLFRKGVNAATLCSYVPKKNKAVILLSSMHYTAMVDDTPESKPEIIQYYNKTKGGVDTMDKMLSEYTVKRKTNRWPLALFFNIVDIAALATFILTTKENSGMSSFNVLRRKFLKSLAKDLCRSSIEKRSKNPHVVGKETIRHAMEASLGVKLMPHHIDSRSGVQRDSTGRIAVVGKCFQCKGAGTNRKTRKCCVKCNNPICDQHSVKNPTCFSCDL